MLASLRIKFSAGGADIVGTGFAGGVTVIMGVGSGAGAGAGVGAGGVGVTGVTGLAGAGVTAGVVAGLLAAGWAAPFAVQAHKARDIMTTDASRK